MLYKKKVKKKNSNSIKLRHFLFKKIRNSERAHVKRLEYTIEIKHWGLKNFCDW